MLGVRQFLCTGNWTENRISFLSALRQKANQRGQFSCRCTGTKQYRLARSLNGGQKQKEMKRAPLKRKKPMNRINPRRVLDYLAYVNERNQFLQQNQFCEFPTHDTIGCPNHSSQIHHAKGRRGTLLRNQKYWWPLCAAHHAWVHSHMKQARKLGLILYK